MDRRATNMQRRRERILEAARRVIAEEGFDALSTRKLAQSAGVTAPTLYNLIGSKAEILEALELAAAQTIEDRLHVSDDRTPLGLAQAIVRESVVVFAEDEAYYRAACVAGDRLLGQSPSGSLKLDARAVALAQHVCAELVRMGALRGTIASAELAAQMYRCYGACLREWAYGRMSLQEFGRQAMRGIALLLGADAVDTFRAQLLKLFNTLDEGYHVMEIANET